MVSDTVLDQGQHPTSGLIATKQSRGKQKEVHDATEFRMATLRSMGVQYESKKDPC